MKKILVLIGLLWSIALPCFATFLDDSPERYHKVFSTINMSAYVDDNSVMVTRYDPPFYIIQADIYNAWYESEIVSKMKCQYFYDYDTKQHFTTFTPPQKLTKLVYTRPELSPLDFLRFGP